MNQPLYDLLHDNPIIAALRSEHDLEACLETDIPVVFVLFGDICSIGGITKKLRDAGKVSLVHIDLIGGLSPREVSVDFLKNSTCADGIISTRANIIQRAKELHFLTVYRVFLIDSASLGCISTVRSLRPDAIDVLPGLMPKIIRKLCSETGIPVLTGGLITEKQDVLQALEAGALAISSTQPAVWNM